MDNDTEKAESRFQTHSRFVIFLLPTTAAAAKVDKKNFQIFLSRLWENKTNLKKMYLARRKKVSRSRPINLHFVPFISPIILKCFFSHREQKFRGFEELDELEEHFYGKDCQDVYARLYVNIYSRPQLLNENLLHYAIPLVSRTSPQPFIISLQNYLVKIFWRFSIYSNIIDDAESVFMNVTNRICIEVVTQI